MKLFIEYLFSDSWFFISWVLIVTFSICVHEYAHAYVALKRGDDTAARAGHLTLNPLVQMGPMSLVMLCVLGLAWGSVPVDPRRYRRPGDAARVAFAGPFSNLLLCILFAVVSLGFLSYPVANETLRQASVANGVLFVLNMLPVPMLDGWVVFSLFMPVLSKLSAEKARQVSLAAILILFMTPLWSLIWDAGDWLSSSVYFSIEALL